MLRLAVLCVAAYVVAIQAYPNGAPLEACDNLTPLHPDDLGEFYAPYTEIDPSSINPYVLSLSDSTVQQGQTLKVSVSSVNNATYYEGFFLVAVEKGDISVKVGRFAEAPEDADWVNGPCSSTEYEDQMASLTHNSKDKKYEHSIEWIADTSMTGDFCIQGAIVHETEEWYKLDGSDDTHCFTITEGEGESVGDETISDVEETAPGGEVSTSDVDETTLDVDEPTHNGNGTTPDVDEMTPAVDENTHDGNETAPDVDEMTPAVDENTHDGNETTHAVDENILNGNETTPAVDEDSHDDHDEHEGHDDHAVDETMPDVDETMTDVDETTHDADETTPDLDETMPDVDETIPGFDETTPVVDETTTGVDEMYPDADGDETTPDTDEMYPDVDEMTPDSDGDETTPDTDEMYPDVDEMTPDADGDETTPDTDGDDTTPDADEIAPVSGEDSHDDHDEHEGHDEHDEHEGHDDHDEHEGHEGHGGPNKDKTFKKDGEENRSAGFAASFALVVVSLVYAQWL